MGLNGSQIYCPGRLLQTVQLAGLFEDSKTFVDKPTTASESEVVAAFDQLLANNGTIEDLVTFVEQYFGGEGLDVIPATLEDFVEQPEFLQNLADPVLRGWLQIVHGYWRDLARTSERNESCSECVSSLIELPNTFIVPGGRFRENYYWDTYFALLGLLTGGLQTTANQTIQNYLYLLETNGFIPNGARIYYKNRSQPPLFIQMLDLYVTSTNDTSFLPRALELSEVEMAWWDTNRTIEVTSGDATYSMHAYNVTNSAPRPESYLEDWETDNGPVGGPYLNLSSSLYRDLASGAESGMDYSVGRWATNPTANLTDNLPSLRTLDLVSIVPVDLNSILYRNYVLLSELYERTGNTSRSDYWSDRAETLRGAIIDLFWDSEALLFKDYNITSGGRHDLWSTAAYYPYWSGIIPDEVLSNQTTAQKAMSGLAYITAHYNGTIPVTLIETGAQWDFPNGWPPQIWIAIKALQALPTNVSSSGFEAYSQDVVDFSYLPPGHFGGLNQGDLPEQIVLGSNASNITSVAAFNELGNVGNTTGLSWRDGLAEAIASRYMSAAFCSWYSTGGSVPGLVNQLPQSDLELTNSAGQSGQMFEKFSTIDLDAAGSGGEYTVQAGFAWTNGVAIWIGRNFGNRLQQPQCPAIEAEAASSEGAQSMLRQLSLRPNLAARRL